MKILNIGSINKDFFYSVNDFVKPGETISSNKFHVKIGGKGLNQSVAISKAGKKVYHAGIKNKDDKFLIDKLKKWNVNCDNILFSDNPTGHAIIQVNKRGENSIIIHAGANYDLDKKFIASTISKFESEDILLIQNEVNFLKKASKKGELNLFGSLLIPSKQFIGRFKFRPWKGVYISDKLLSSLDNFHDFTEDLVFFYKKNNITPVIETDFSSTEKLDYVYSLFRNQR